MTERSLPGGRVDERDTMFARMSRREGTPAYEEYYARRPERRAGDDRLRAMTPLMSPGGLHYDERICGEAGAWFDAIDAIVPDAVQVEAMAGRIRNGANPSAPLKAAALELGAVAAGCTNLDPAFVYTHKGRFDEDYGRPVTLTHGWALVFLVEMDHGAMARAPGAEAIRESARQYYRAAVAAKTLAAAIAAAGWSARAHYDAHYDVILPPLAVSAGLGELGRNNILIAHRFGSRVRIGAVTTDLPLVPGKARSLGAEAFCGICMKCADACPSGALSRGDRVSVRGVLKWPTDDVRCYRYWRAIGTDCGVCMAVCPFSHRDTAFHNAVRWAVRHLPRAHRALLFMDDLVYGRRKSGAPAS